MDVIDQVADGIDGLEARRVIAEEATVVVGLVVMLDGWFSADGGSR